MNMFARFDENPAMTLQDIKETKRYGWTHGCTHGRTDGQRENSIPTTNKVCGGYKNKCMNFRKYEPQHVISNNVVCATSKASDQPAHRRSLIRAFASRLNIL